MSWRWRSILAAAAAGTTRPDGTIKLVNPPASASDAYPLSSYTYVIVPETSPKASVLKAFLVLSITLSLGLVLGSARASAARRAVGASLAGAYLLGVLLDFTYMYPVLAAKVISYAAWLSRMWYHPGGHGWI